MGDHAAIMQLIRESFEDQAFSRRERRDVRREVEGVDLNEHEKAVLRSEVFDFAREQLANYDPNVVVDWLENAMKALITVDHTFDGAKAYFSPGMDCLSAIKDELHNATHKVRICVFTISDDRITREIINKHRQGVDVKIITDNDKSEDRGSDIDQMHREGIPIKVDTTSNHMHHKFAILDNKTLITGSYNWTRSAEKYNQENIVLLRDENMIRRFKDEFYRLWDKLERY